GQPGGRRPRDGGASPPILRFQPAPPNPRCPAGSPPRGAPPETPLAKRIAVDRDLAAAARNRSRCPADSPEAHATTRRESGAWARARTVPAAGRLQPAARINRGRSPTAAPGRPLPPAP